MLRTAAKGFGFVFLLIGVLGFFPAFAPDGHLLGIFEVNAVHNIIHLVSGVVALWAGYASAAASRRYFQIFGVIYGLVTLLGFLNGDSAILGVIAHNTADIFLHLVITVAALALGFGGADRQDSAAV